MGFAKQGHCYFAKAPERIFAFDHRMTSHKRLVIEDYARKYVKVVQVPPSVTIQEENNFKLAMKIQEEESRVIEVNSLLLHKDSLEVVSAYG